jgi:hypothetical protein
MRYSLLLPVATGVASVCLFGMGILGLFSRSGLVAANQMVDLGKCVQNQTYDVRFDLVNHERSSLEILSVQAGCSCLIADLSTKTLPEGKSTPLLVKWSTGTSRGNQKKDIMVVYALDQKQFVLPLQIKGEVEADYWCSQKKLTFGLAERGRTMVRFTPSRTNVTLESVLCTHRGLSASVVAFDGLRSDIEVLFDPDVWQGGSGHNVARLVVRTNSVAEPIFQIPIDLTE